jgi:hypothetical protein
MISSPGCLCLPNATPGSKSMRTWTTSRPGTPRSCRLEISPLDSRLLRPRHLQHQTASDDQHRYRHDSSRFHVAPFSS